MKLYNVSIPIAGSCNCVVAAESEEAAKERALEQDYGDRDGESDPDYDTANVEWEFHEHLTQGNVLYASQNDIEVTIEDDEDIER